MSGWNVLRSSVSNGNGFGSQAEQDVGKNDVMFSPISVINDGENGEDDLDNSLRISVEDKPNLRKSTGERGIDGLTPAVDEVFRKESKISPAPIGTLADQSNRADHALTASFFSFNQPNAGHSNHFNPSAPNSIFHNSPSQNSSHFSNGHFNSPFAPKQPFNPNVNHFSPSASNFSSSPFAAPSFTPLPSNFGPSPQTSHGFQPMNATRPQFNTFAPSHPHHTPYATHSDSYVGLHGSSSLLGNTNVSHTNTTANRAPVSAVSSLHTPQHISKLFGSSNPLNEALRTPPRGGSAPPHLGGFEHHVQQIRQKDDGRGRSWTPTGDEYDGTDLDDQFSSVSLHQQHPSSSSSSRSSTMSPFTHTPSPVPSTHDDDEEDLFEIDVASESAPPSHLRSPSPSRGPPVERTGSGSMDDINQLLSNYDIPYAPICGEHPLGEHPSRTLFVRNINSNVEDDELAQLFEQHGHIRSMYTQCKHRGFVMISYYDIRHAKNAMRHLQGRILRRRKLDIHYSIPKDNPSEKDQNQGTLVVFNLDPATTNEELKSFFGHYGEIKEIRETPNKKHHKFVEFYDVREAERAMKGLNKTEIRGKKIKIEPSRPGGARKPSLSHTGSSENVFYEEELACNPPSLSSTFYVSDSNPSSPFGVSPISPPTYTSPSQQAQLQQAVKYKSTTGSNFAPVSPPHPHSLYRTQSPTPSTHFSATPPLTPSSSTLFSRSPEHHSPTGSPSRGFTNPVVRSSSLDSSGGGVWNPIVHNSPSRGYMPAVDSITSPSPIHFGFSPSTSPSPSPPVPLEHSSSTGSLPNPSKHHGPVTGGRHRSESNEDKHKFSLNLSRVKAGADVRTTLMIKNIPNKYTQKMLLAAVDEKHKGTYDFFYLPIDFKNKCNVGYAFINMLSAEYIVPFYEEFNNKKWEKFNSEKVCEITYARIQGKNNLITHFQNSSLMSEDKKCRPIIFHSEGPNAGEPEPFPVAPNMRRRGSSSGSQDELRITSISEN